MRLRPPAAPACESFVSGCESPPYPPDLELPPECVCVIKCPEDQGALRGLHLVLGGRLVVVVGAGWFRGVLGGGGGSALAHLKETLMWGNKSLPSC